MTAPVIVIGLGPAGCIAARVLAAAGHPVLALQPQPPAGGRAPLVAPAPTARDSPEAEARPAEGPQQGRDGLGGAKLLAAPQSYRLDEGAYRLRSLALAAGGGPDDLVVDWPFGGDELEPFHRRVERMVGTAPRPATGWTERMSAAAASLDWRPFAAPAAALGDLSTLLAHPGVVVRDATALAIRTGSTGEARAVELLDADGRREVVAARAIVLAGAVLPSVRLLLLSGLTAGGRVGEGFLAHHMLAVHGLFPGVDLGREAAGQATAVAVSAFETAALAEAGAEVLGGSVLQAAMTGPRGAGWAAAVRGGLEERDAGAWVAGNAASIGTVWAQPEQLARAAQRIDLDPAHVDALGRPVARVTAVLDADDLRRHALLARRMTQWLHAAGASRTWTARPAAQPLGTHLYGGARMGADPAASVVDPFGRLHETPGLVVLGGSTFPTAGGRGPVQTVEALAWRSASRLVADLV